MRKHAGSSRSSPAPGPTRRTFLGWLMAAAMTLRPGTRLALTPPERVTVSQWIDRNVLLGDDSAEPGTYHTSRTPYVREWQDNAAFPWVHQTTIHKSTQIGGTQALLNVLAYAVAQDPGPVTWAMPTREDANEFGENRVQPMVDASPTLRAQMTGERFDAKRRQIQFRRCRVLFRSAVTAKELAQYPARWLFADEANKWPLRAQGEAAPFDLARERCRTFWNHKVYLSSTPTIGEGLISVEFERGDRRRYHVPCPHCGAFQVLSWKRVKWDNAKVDTEAKMRDAREAWYECERCSQKILDAHKQDMLARGFWCPEGIDPAPHIVDGRLELPDDRAPHRSYHIWAGYSPWLAWWEIVAEFLRSSGNPRTLQNFVNSWLAEAWVDRVEDTPESAIAACVEPRLQGDCPDEVLAVTAAVDVQKDRVEWSVEGWGLDEESWLLAAGRVMQQSGGRDWKELGDALFGKTWGKQQLRIRCCVVDSRYRRDEVLEFVRKWQPAARMIVGVERETPIPFTTLRIDKHPRTGAVLPNALTVWSVNVGWFKDLVAARILRTLADPNTKAGRLHLPSDLPVDWIEQMSSEHKVREISGSKEVHRWVLKPGHRRNEAWDLTVYNAAAARLIRCDTLRSDGEGDAPPPAPARPPRPTRPHRPPGARFPLLGGRR